MPSTVLDALEGLEINLSTTEQCLETKNNSLSIEHGNSDIVAL